MDDDWARCDAETVVAALSVRYRFSRANAVQLLRDEGILLPRAEAKHDDDVEEAEGWSSEEEDDEEHDPAVIISMPGQDLVSVGAMVAGTGATGFQDGAAATAMFRIVRALLHLPDGRVLAADEDNHCIRVLSADRQQVSTAAGGGGAGHRDGAAAQAQFWYPNGLALLPDGGVLVADWGNNRIRVLSADMQQVSTVTGDGGHRHRGHRDGAVAQAQFTHPIGEVVGDDEGGHLDGAAAQAQFNRPVGLALLPDGRVLVADQFNHRIRALSADLQQVSTVAGDGAYGLRDGAAAQAQFCWPSALALLPDGRVLVADRNSDRIRVLSADLQQVSTLTNAAGLSNVSALELLPDGRLLVGDNNRIHVLEGFPAALLSTKPSYKPPKKTNQQQEKKRALAGGANSSSLVLKHSRSGASGSNAAAAAAVSTSDSEGEEQPGGSAAEAERSSGLVPKRSRSGASSSATAAAMSSSDSEGEEPVGSAAEAEPLV